MYDSSAIIIVAFTGVVLFVPNDDVGGYLFCCYLCCYSKAFNCGYKHDLTYNLSWWLKFKTLCGSITMLTQQLSFFLFRGDHVMFDLING